MTPPPHVEYTVDGKPVKVGMRVWTNDLRLGTVVKALHTEDRRYFGEELPGWTTWYEIAYDNGRTAILNGERMSVRQPPL